MNNLAATLLLTHATEEEAFWVLVCLIEKILPSEYIRSHLLVSQADQRVLIELVRRTPCPHCMRTLTSWARPTRNHVCVVPVAVYRLSSGRDAVSRMGRHVCRRHGDPLPRWPWPSSSCMNASCSPPRRPSSFYGLAHSLTSRLFGFDKLIHLGMHRTQVHHPLRQHPRKTRTARGVVPVEVLHPLVDVRVSVADGAQVALEVRKVDGVEADDGGVEADVGLGERVGVQVGAAVGEQSFPHGRASRRAGLRWTSYGLLRGGKAALVHAIVDVGYTHSWKASISLSRCLGVERLAAELLWDAARQRHDGHGAALRVLGIGDLVELRGCASCPRGRGCGSPYRHTEPLGLVVGDEAPAPRAEERVDDMDGAAGQAPGRYP
ncbi:hypothetical protein L1887_59657 [Cichorium endivia]|nr:hypothetical protein L1887_59657 [Cichorium endivia]